MAWALELDRETRELIARMWARGYTLNVWIIINGCVEIHAWKASDPAQLYISRCWDGFGAEQLHAAALALDQLLAAHHDNDAHPGGLGDR